MTFQGLKYTKHEEARQAGVCMCSNYASNSMEKLTADHRDTAHPAPDSSQACTFPLHTSQNLLANLSLLGLGQAYGLDGTCFQSITHTSLSFETITYLK